MEIHEAAAGSLGAGREVKTFAPPPSAAAAQANRIGGADGAARAIWGSEGNQWWRGVIQAVGKDWGERGRQSRDGGGDSGAGGTILAAPCLPTPFFPLHSCP